MVYSWDKANAQMASRRRTQYFEMMGSRAIYQNGWIASVPPWNPPWNITLKSAPADVMNGFPAWQLYNVSEDWTQANDLAAKMPDKLRDLQEAWTMEATKYNVFPLDADLFLRFISVKPSYNAGRTTFTYSGELANVPFSDAGNAASLLNRSYTITAEVEIPQGAEGMLVTEAGRFAGYGFYLLKGKPVFTWDLDGVERVKWRGNDALTPGKHTLEFDWTYDGPGLGKGGTGTLKADGKVLDSHAMSRSVPIDLMFEGFDVGLDTGTPVDDQDYQVPFRFTGKINKLTIKLGPTQLTSNDRQVIQHALATRD
jgi:arylsulfatase